MLILVSWLPSISSDEKIFEDETLDSSLIFTPSSQEIYKFSLNDNMEYQTLNMIVDSKKIGNQTQPAISSNQNDCHFLAYKDDAIGEIVWGTIGEDTGYYDLDGGFYPSIKHWNGTSFFGTFVPDSLYHNGGAIFLMQTTNPNDIGTYVLGSWQWDSQGWYNITDSEIACGSSDEPWNWGYISFISSSTYSEGFINSPQVTYQIDEDGAMALAWSPIEHCNHTDAYIDTITKKTYSIYDRFYNSSWQLFLMINDFNDNMSFVDSYDIVGIQNLTCPKITVNNDNMVIVAETNQNYNKDIICIYGTPENPQQTLITTGDSDEQYPEIEYIGNTTYVCSYISNNQLYISISPTGGMTWSNPIKIRDNVIESYKSTDLSESLDYIGYELMNDSNIDVMFDDNRLSIVYIDDDFSPSTPGWQYDHFDVIQDGIDAVAENGTVYVFNGTYYENLVVNKTIDLIGQDRNNTIIHVNTVEFYYGIQIVVPHVKIANISITAQQKNNNDRDQVNIEQLLSFNNKRVGPIEFIRIEEGGDFTEISHCTIFDILGILNVDSSYNHFNNCTFENTYELLFSEGTRNVIEDCVFYNNLFSVVFAESYHNILRNNIFGKSGVLIVGFELSEYFHTISNNYIENKPIIYLTNQTDVTYDTAEVGEFILVNCSNINIENCNISNSSCGVELAFSSNVSIDSCQFNNNFMSIMNFFTNETRIVGNSIVNNYYGIYYYTENDNSNISNNDFINNEWIAVDIEYSNSNIISYNYMSDNGGAIYFGDADNNHINNNKIINNENGILLGESVNNSIYHNVFIGNNLTAMDDGYNNWDNGYPSRGNYWDDYTGTDANGDGIGDTPYNISGGSNQDLYPFIEEDGWLKSIDVNQDVFGRGFPIRHAIDGDWAGAQSFKTSNHSLTRVDIYLRKFGNPEFNLTLEVRENSPDGTLIESFEFQPDDVNVNWGWFILDLEDITTTPDTDYFIVCPPAPSSVTTSFGYEWGYAFGNQYDDGAFWFTRDGGGLWRDLPTMYEFVFRTYGYN